MKRLQNLSIHSKFNDFKEIFKARLTCWKNWIFHMVENFLSLDWLRCNITINSSDNFPWKNKIWKFTWITQIPQIIWFCCFNTEFIFFICRKIWFSYLMEKRELFSSKYWFSICFNLLWLQLSQIKFIGKLWKKRFSFCWLFSITSNIQ